MITYEKAIQRIIYSERYNTSADHYLNTYDIALHVIFGTRLYHGAGDCAIAAKKHKKKGK